MMRENQNNLSFNDSFHNPKYSDHDTIPSEVITIAQTIYPNGNKASVLKALYSAMYYIKNFCNIEIIPHDLYFTWVEMAGYDVKFEVKEKEGNSADAGLPFPNPDNNLPSNIMQLSVLKSLKEVSMGDTSITFKDSYYEEEVENPREEYDKYKNRDEFRKTFHTTLYNFRRFKW